MNWLDQQLTLIDNLFHAISGLLHTMAVDVLPLLIKHLSVVLVPGVIEVFEFRSHSILHFVDAFFVHDRGPVEHFEC